MRELYTPAAYFGRLDALYLDGWLRWGRAQLRYLHRHPLRCVKLNARLLAEALAIFVLLMRGVPHAALRREYRRRLLRVAWRRPTPRCSSFTRSNARCISTSTS